MPKRSNSRSGGPGRRWNDHENHPPIESVSLPVSAGAETTQWFAGCGMLVAGGFSYRMLVDESCIARESQNAPAPARASDRLLSIVGVPWSPHPPRQARRAV